MLLGSMARRIEAYRQIEKKSKEDKCERRQREKRERRKKEEEVAASSLR